MRGESSQAICFMNSMKIPGNCHPEETMKMVLWVQVQFLHGMLGQIWIILNAAMSRHCPVWRRTRLHHSSLS